MPIATCTSLIASKGTKVFVSAALPADYEIATYDALSWTEVGMVEDVPDFGPNATVNTFVPIGTGDECKYLGTNKFPDIAIPMAKTTDAGRAIIAAEERTGKNIAVKIELSDMGSTEVGTVGVAASRYCFLALVTGMPVNPGGVEGVVKNTPTLAVQGSSWATGDPADGTAT